MEKLSKERDERDNTPTESAEALPKQIQSSSMEKIVSCVEFKEREWGDTDIARSIEETTFRNSEEDIRVHTLEKAKFSQSVSHLDRRKESEIQWGMKLPMTEKVATSKGR